MKKIFIYFSLLLGVTSCGPVNYFQVFKSESENHQKQKDALIFEDANCKILYNLWSENGDIGFIFYNKTDKTIFINKGECFFISNGFAYDYYQNRSFTQSSSIGILNNKGGAVTKSTGSQSSTSVGYSKSETNLRLAGSGILTSESSGVSTTEFENQIYSVNLFSSQSTNFSKGFSVTTNEPFLIRIPPKSAKVISEFKIVTTRYKNCDLISFPSKGIKSMTFTKENSPLTFSNRLCYCLDSNCRTPTIINNSFYINEIQNMSANEFYKKDFEYNCGKKSEFPVYFRKYSSPDKFYLMY